MCAHAQTPYVRLSVAVDHWDVIFKFGQRGEGGKMKSERERTRNEKPVDRAWQNAFDRNLSHRLDDLQITHLSLFFFFWIETLGWGRAKLLGWGGREQAALKSCEKTGAPFQVCGMGQGAGRLRVPLLWNAPPSFVSTQTGKEKNEQKKKLEGFLLWSGYDRAREDRSAELITIRHSTGPTVGFWGGHRALRRSSL